MGCQISSEYELGHGLTQWVELRDVLSDLNAMEAPGIFHSLFTNTLESYCENMFEKISDVRSKGATTRSNVRH